MPLPDWFHQYRPHQSAAIESIVEAFNENDIVVLDAPTGSGKTLIAESVRQEFNCRALYLCSSLHLQQQFLRDYPYACLLMGRSNYPSLTEGVSCADCDKWKEELDNGKSVWHCTFCNPVSKCPYQNTKMDAIRAQLVCSNTYYFLYEANYQGALSHRPLVIVDECDTLEEILLSFVQVHIPSRTAKALSIEPPTKKTVEEAWVDWAEQSLRTLRRATVRDNGTIREARRRRQVSHLITDLERLTDPVGGIKAGGWVYTGYAKGDITFRPITVDRYAQQYLWRHGRKWLLMSATVISTEVLLKSLGVGAGAGSR